MHLNVLCRSIWIRKWCEEWSKSVRLATPTEFEMQTIYLRAFLLIAYDSSCQPKKHWEEKQFFQRERAAKLLWSFPSTHKYLSFTVYWCVNCFTDLKRAWIRVVERAVGCLICAVSATTHSWERNKCIHYIGSLGRW